MANAPDLESIRAPVSDAVHRDACRYRLRRVRESLARHDCDAILLFDPVNIRYATDTTNMSLWTMHNYARYALVFAGGPVVLWEFHRCAHLHDGNAQVDEIRDAVVTGYTDCGPRLGERTAAWADDLLGVLRRHAGRAPRLAADRADYAALSLVAEGGVALRDGQRVMEQARLIKSDDEIELMRRAMGVCEAGIRRMHDELRPGMTEVELWSWLHFENIRRGGEWIETRLLCSGPRTNPWMREASGRVMREGELVCFDTDLIGPYGYCADVSRAWTVGHVPPSPAQRDLYRLAHEQVHTNMALLRPGLSLGELSAQAWPIPRRFHANRYSYLMHGVGMCDEYPGVAHAGQDWRRTGHDLVLEPNMVFCVESYVGEEGGAEGVKLEQQLRITPDGYEELSTWPWNEDWL